jgi:hypothetical protein
MTPKDEKAFPVADVGALTPVIHPVTKTPGEAGRRLPQAYDRCLSFDYAASDRQGL